MIESMNPEAAAFYGALLASAGFASVALVKRQPIPASALIINCAFMAVGMWVAS